MSAEDARKLFVGGLNDAASEEALRAIFSDAGFSISHLALPRDRETGRVRGFAFVTLATEDEAAQARARLQGAMCGGRSISLREFSQGPKKEGGGPPRARPSEDATVFLGKLPFDVTPDEISQLFAEQGCGPVVRVTLPAGPDGRPRGFGFATLESAEVAARAVEKVSGAAIRGRSIVVSPAQPRGPRPGAPGPGYSGPGYSGQGQGYGSGGGGFGASGPRGGYRGNDGPPEARYEVRGPRAVREPEPQYSPSEPPQVAPLDEEGRRRKAGPARKDKGVGAGAGERKRGDDQKKRKRGGGSSWQQWDSEDD